MDKATATKFVERIEAHRAEEAAIWDEMRARDDYESNEDKTIKSILDARRKGREMLEEADADLGAFDWVDDGTGNFVPREEVSEPAWPGVSEQLKKAAAGNPNLLRVIGHIDRLHEMSMARGLPVVTVAQLEAETSA